MITSAQNRRVKLVRQLQRHTKARRRQRQLVLEGPRLIEDAVSAGVQPDFVLYTDPAPDLIAALDHAGIPCLAVSETLMQAMTDTETPQGILAVVPWPELPAPPRPRLVLVVDGWRDPGNLGTVIRTAAAAGVDLIALTPGTVDPFNPKVLRAGMGGHFRVPLQEWDLAGPPSAAAALAWYLADADGDVPYDAADWSAPAAIVVGAEAHGLHTPARALPHTTLQIPMVPGAESLNAAVAASLLLYTAARSIKIV